MVLAAALLGVLFPFAPATFAATAEGTSDAVYTYDDLYDSAPMNKCNSDVARGVLAAISDLEAGTRALAEVQAVLQRAIPRFENDGSGVAEAVRLAEADLEEIQFTNLLDEQVPAAIFRLDELRATIEGAADG